MHELLVAIDKPSIQKTISLCSDSKFCKSFGDHVIKINSVLDDDTRKIIEPILARRNLKIEKIEDAYIIH